MTQTSQEILRTLEKIQTLGSKSKKKQIFKMFILSRSSIKEKIILKIDVT